MKRDSRGYVLRRAKGAEFGDDDEFIPVCTFTIERYRCGLRAGDHLRLIRDLQVEDGEGAVARVIPAGTIWEVLNGAIEDPDALWLEQPDGELHSWDDDLSIFDTFERFTA